MIGAPLGDPFRLCAPSLVTCCTARGLARRVLLSYEHVARLPMRRALPRCQTMQPSALPALLPPSAAQLSCVLMQLPECDEGLPQCLPQRPKTLLCVCGCQGQPCNLGCLAATLADRLAGVQPAAPGQPDTLARMAACPTHQIVCCAACGSQGAKSGCGATGG